MLYRRRFAKVLMLDGDLIKICELFRPNSTRRPVQIRYFLASLMCDSTNRGCGTQSPSIKIKRSELDRLIAELRALFFLKPRSGWFRW